MEDSVQTGSSFFAERAGKEEKEKDFPIHISNDLITSLRGKDEKKGEIIGTRKDFVSIWEHLLNTCLFSF